MTMSAPLQYFYSNAGQTMLRICSPTPTPEIPSPHSSKNSTPTLNSKKYSSRFSITCKALHNLTPHTSLNFSTIHSAKDLRTLPYGFLWQPYGSPHPLYSMRQHLPHINIILLEIRFPRLVTVVFSYHFP